MSYFAVKLERATLAEKEVSALKEQLAAANDGNSKTEGHKLSQTPQGSDQQQVHDASNPRRTPNTNLEQELQAKDKEEREKEGKKTKEERKSSFEHRAKRKNSRRLNVWVNGGFFIRKKNAW
ncbi:homeobox protein cut isoform X3 [Apis mellifera carnica]|nr:homeobox protein cut isoform X3 [Apis mellifera carnica]